MLKGPLIRERPSIGHCQATSRREAKPYTIEGLFLGLEFLMPAIEENGAMTLLRDKLDTKANVVLRLYGGRPIFAGNHRGRVLG